MINEADEQYENILHQIIAYSRTPKELFDNLSTLGGPEYISAVISMEDYDPLSRLPLLEIPHQLRKQYLSPYLKHKNIYLFENRRLIIPRIPIDYSVAFDTNYASYSNDFARGKQIKDLEIKRNIDDMLRSNLNFDPIFYWVENSKIAYPIAQKLEKSGNFTPAKFWDELGIDLTDNFVGLTLMSGVDTEYYKQHGVLKFDISLEEAERKSVTMAYEMYAGVVKPLIEDRFLLFQLTNMLLLIAMFKIQYSSNKGLREKMREFFEYMDIYDLVYFERETMLAYHYFNDRNSVPFLQGINRGGLPKNLLKVIDNLAWDMVAPRFLEGSMIISQQGQCLLPFFMSNDKRLVEMMSYYPVKGVIINRSSGWVTSIPVVNLRQRMATQNCESIMNHFFSADNIEKRAKREPKSNDSLRVLIEKECNELEMLLST